MEISQEQAQEYMEVAGLVCFEIDLLKDIAESRPKANLVKHIQQLYREKEKIIADKKHRQSRYEATRMVFAVAAAGIVRSTPIQG